MQSKKTWCLSKHLPIKAANRRRKKVVNAERKGERERKTETEREKERDREREKERERKRKKEREGDFFSCYIGLKIRINKKD